MLTSKHRIFRQRLIMHAAFVALLSPAPYAYAFDPSQGNEPVGIPKSVKLPSTAALTEQPKIQFPEVTGALPQQPVAQPITTSAAPAIPPVDPVIAQQASREMQKASAAPSAPGFIAPAPLLSTPEVASPPPATAVVPMAQESTPIQTASVAPISPLPEESLSVGSKTIVGGIPSKLDTPKSSKNQKLKVSRATPDLQSLAASSPKIDSYDSVGLSIKVQRPGLDTNYELNRAYTALMGGETETATSIYKNILSSEPNNEDALFGLGSIYHRAGDLDKARPFYGQLLKQNPQHREGLNNFMALIGDEAPQEALAELERLEQRNPDFSPIPAQQAILLQKLGFKEQARDKILRAIELAPENLTYKLNLAVMLDNSGHYTDAAALYRLLIDASLKGEKVPATVESLQKRLNYIASVSPYPTATGG